MTNILHYCAGSACPGLPYRASDCEHPASCTGINESPAAACYDRVASGHVAHLQAAICQRCLEAATDCECDADEQNAFDAAAMTQAAEALVELSALVTAAREVVSASDAIKRWTGRTDADVITHRLDASIEQLRRVLKDFAAVVSTTTDVNEAGQPIPSVSPDADRLAGSPSDGSEKPS